MKDKDWIINTYDPKQTKELSDAVDVSEVMAKLLIRRNYSCAENALEFIKKDINSFHSPFLMKDVEKGAALLIESVKNKVKILIWGDYDVDGVTSVTVLLKYIRSIGGDCEYYIPKRDDDGYGLNDRVIDKYIDQGFGLLITVDSGITAINEVANAKSKGMRVIVTDHHECRNELPAADAVINPKRFDCTYPFKELAGVGVVFKFICAVEMMMFGINNVKAVSKLITFYSEFVAIGTIADVMPIVDENRLIVSKGLSSIEKTSNKGLSALIEEAGIDSSFAKKRKISSTTIGFVLAPRINAAGRMETSEIAVELFMTESYEEAAKLAARLGEINKDRQRLENESLVSALSKINDQCDIDNDKVIVLEDDNWHHGIIGIVSSRITEKYNLPSVLISFKNETALSDPEIGKGSARSIKGMNLVKALSECSDLLQKFGGHELAAGLSIKRSDLDQFRKRINDHARNIFNGKSLIKTLDIDCEISPEEVSVELANELNMLEPFGLSNPVPVFCATDMRITSIIPIGDSKHTKLMLEKNGIVHVALMFGVPTSSFTYFEGDFVDVAFNIDINNFRNQQNVQMVVRDIRPSKIERDIISQHIYTYENMISNEGYAVNVYDIPTRTDFAQVYTYIRSALERKAHETDVYELDIPYLVKYLQKKNSYSIPLYKAMIVVDVLAETSLIEEKHSSDALTRVLSCQYERKDKGKVVLENAPTILKLFSKNRDHRKDQL